MFRKTSRNQAKILGKENSGEECQIPGTMKTDPTKNNSLHINNRKLHYASNGYIEKLINSSELQSKDFLSQKSRKFPFDSRIDDDNKASLNNNQRILSAPNNNKQALNSIVKKFDSFHNCKNMPTCKSLQFIITDNISRQKAGKSSDCAKYSSNKNIRKEISFLSLNKKDINYSKQPWYLPNFDFCLSKTSENCNLDIIRESSFSKENCSLKDFKTCIRPSFNKVMAKADDCNFKKVINTPQQYFGHKIVRLQQYIQQSVPNYDISTSENDCPNSSCKKNEKVKKISSNKPLKMLTDVSTIVVKDSNDKQAILKSCIKYDKKYSFQEIRTNDKQNKTNLMKTEKNDLNKSTNASNTIQSECKLIKDFKQVEIKKNGKRPERKKFENNTEAVSSNISKSYLKANKKHNFFELTGLKLPLQMANNSFIPCHFKYSVQNKQANAGQKQCFNKNSALLTVKNVILHDIASQQSSDKEMKGNKIYKWIEDCSKVVHDTSFSNNLVSSF